jgi:hypothetical protein
MYIPIWLLNLTDWITYKSQKMDIQPVNSQPIVRQASEQKESLGTTNFHLCWIPHELTTGLRQIRIETCRELSLILKAHENNKFQRFVTGDESSFPLEFHHSTKWSVSRDDVLQKIKQQIETQKSMLTVIWEIDGFHVADLMTEEHSYNIPYYLSHILEPLLFALFPDDCKQHSCRLSLHLDN